MWPRNSDVGARQRPLILPKAAHVKRKTASRFSLNDGQQESSVNSSIADFVGGSVLLSMYGSILMSAEDSSLRPANPAMVHAFCSSEGPNMGGQMICTRARQVTFRALHLPDPPPRARWCANPARTSQTSLARAMTEPPSQHGNRTPVCGTGRSSHIGLGARDSLRERRQSILGRVPGFLILLVAGFRLCRSGGI